MAIKKQFLKSKPICKVTFEVAAENAKSVAVVGDFNHWDKAASPLKKLKSGIFKATLSLAKDKAYEFRYLIDGTYRNEKMADAFQWNAYANDENSVLKV